MLKKILIGIVVIIAAILAFALTKPDTFSVERTAAINAPPQIVFAQIDDFHNWLPWSPWEKLDPGMKRTYSGPQSGTGAAYAWEGNSDVGAGRMEILESTAPTKILIKLDFTAPMEASSTTEFELTPRGESTEVRWTMSGPNQYISKLMQVFMSMDAMVGKDFESGLAALKAVSEKVAAEAPPVVNAPLTLERVLDAPRAAVWKAWTDPKIAARWWGPKGYTSPVWKLDLREGGKYLASMRGPDGKDIWNTGTYLKIVPQEELQFTDSFADEKGYVVPSSHYGLQGFPTELKTRVTFADEGAKTKMTIHYDEFPGGENRDMSVAGWNESIDKLADVLKK